MPHLSPRRRPPRPTALSLLSHIIGNLTPTPTSVHLDTLPTTPPTLLLLHHTTHPPPTPPSHLLTTVTRLSPHATHLTLTPISTSAVLLRPSHPPRRLHSPRDAVLQPHLPLPLPALRARLRCGALLLLTFPFTSASPADVLLPVSLRAHLPLLFLQPPFPLHLRRKPLRPLLLPALLRLPRNFSYAPRAAPPRPRHPPAVIRIGLHPARRPPAHHLGLHLYSRGVLLLPPVRHAPLSLAARARNLPLVVVVHAHFLTPAPDGPTARRDRLFHGLLTAVDRHLKAYLSALHRPHLLAARAHPAPPPVWLRCARCAKWRVAAHPAAVTRDDARARDWTCDRNAPLTASCAAPDDHGARCMVKGPPALHRAQLYSAAPASASPPKRTRSPPPHPTHHEDEDAHGSCPASRTPTVSPTAPKRPRTTHPDPPASPAAARSVFAAASNPRTPSSPAPAQSLFDINDFMTEGPALTPSRHPLPDAPFSMAVPPGPLQDSMNSPMADFPPPFENLGPLEGARASPSPAIGESPGKTIDMAEALFPPLPGAAQIDGRPDAQGGKPRPKQLPGMGGNGDEPAPEARRNVRNECLAEGRGEVIQSSSSVSNDAASQPRSWDNTAMDLGSDGREAFGFDEVPDSRYRSRHTGRQVVQRQGTDARSQAHNRSENIRMGAQHSSRFSGEKRKAGVTGELPLELRRALIWEGDADPIQPAHVASTAPCRSRERRELHSSAQGSMDKQQEDESLQDIARLSDADCLPSPSRSYAQSGPNAYLVAGQARPKPVAVGPAHGNERRHRSPDQRRTQARQSAVIATGHGATVQTDALQREGGDDEQCDSRNEELSRLDRDEGAIRKTQTYADAVKMAKEAAASAAKAVLDSFLSAGMIDKSTGANRNRVQQNCDRIGHSVAEAGGFVAARITEETPAVGSSQRNIASKQYSMPLTCRNPRDLSKRALDGTQSPLTKRCRYPPASASKSSKQISSLPPEGEGVNPESLEKDLLGKKGESERRYAECTVQQLWQQLERSRVSQKAVRESLKNIRTLVHIFLHQVVGVLRKDDYDEPVENYLRDYLKVMGKLPMQLHK